QYPAALTSDFLQLLGQTISYAVAQGDVAVASTLESLRQVLAAMAGNAATDEPAALFEVLVGMPLKPALIAMADAPDWDSWQQILLSLQEIYSVAFVDLLNQIKDRIQTEDRWVLEQFMLFLQECQQKDPVTTVNRWRSGRNVGEAVLLPQEYQLQA